MTDVGKFFVHVHKQKTVPKENETTVQKPSPVQVVDNPKENEKKERKRMVTVRIMSATLKRATPVIILARNCNHKYDRHIGVYRGVNNSDGADKLSACGMLLTTPVKAQCPRRKDIPISQHNPDNTGQCFIKYKYGDCTPSGYCQNWQCFMECIIKKFGGPSKNDEDLSCYTKKDNASTHVGRRIFFPLLDEGICLDTWKARYNKNIPIKENIMGENGGMSEADEMEAICHILANVPEEMEQGEQEEDEKQEKEQEDEEEDINEDSMGSYGSSNNTSDNNDGQDQRTSPVVELIEDISSPNNQDSTTNSPQEQALIIVQPVAPIVVTTTSPDSGTTEADGSKSKDKEEWMSLAKGFVLFTDMSAQIDQTVVSMNGHVDNIKTMKRKHDELEQQIAAIRVQLLLEEDEVNKDIAQLNVMIDKAEAMKKLKTQLLELYSESEGLTKQRRV